MIARHDAVEYGAVESGRFVYKSGRIVLYLFACRVKSGNDESSRA
jgi:hypothetical protein